MVLSELEALHATPKATLPKVRSKSRLSSTADLLSELKEQGVEVVKASLDNVEELVEACQGAKFVFGLTDVNSLLSLRPV